MTTSNKSGFTSEWLRIGKITRLHGWRGELFISLPMARFQVLERGAELARQLTEQALCFQKKGMPGFQAIAQKAVFHKKGILVSLQGMSKARQVQFLKGAKVYASRRLFSSRVGEQLYLCEIQGFEVIDKTRGSLGHIHAFFDNGMYDFLVVQNLDKASDSSSNGQRAHRQEISSLDKTPDTVQKITPPSRPNKKSLEIPFLEEFVLRIDFDSESLLVDLPPEWPGWD